MLLLTGWGQALFIVLVAGWFLVGWFRTGRIDRTGAAAALAAALLALLVNQVLGHVWDRPRPFVAEAGVIHQLVTHARDSSFPSDHAAAAFAIASVFLALRRRLGLVILALALLVSAARLYAGLHYPSDVAAGALVGIGSGLLWVWILSLQRDRLDRVLVLPSALLPARLRPL